MDEICSSQFGPIGLSSQKVRSPFIDGPAEKSAVLTVATLLARNVYHIGGTLAVPQKCRLTLIGKLMSVYVFVWLYRQKYFSTELSTSQHLNRHIMCKKTV